MNTINVNGSIVPTAYLKLITAKSALKMMKLGLKIRNVNVKIIKQSLAAEGVQLVGRTAAECLAEVESMIAVIKGA